MGAVDLDRTLQRHNTNRGRQTDRWLFRPTACQTGTGLPGLGDDVVSKKTWINRGETEGVEEMGFNFFLNLVEANVNRR